MGSKASGTASVTSSVKEDFVLLLTLCALQRTAKNIVVLSVQGKRPDF